MRSIPGFGRINRIGMIRTTSKLRAKIKLTDKKEPDISIRLFYAIRLRIAGAICNRVGCGGYQMMPWAIMASATFRKPAMLAPFM